MKTKTAPAAAIKIRRKPVSITSVLVEDLYHEVVSGCEHHPLAYSAAMAALLHEDFQMIATYYRHACMTKTGKKMTKQFLKNMIEGDE